MQSNREGKRDSAEVELNSNTLWQVSMMKINHQVPQRKVSRVLALVHLEDKSHLHRK